MSEASLDNSAPSKTIRSVFWQLITHPFERIIKRWNWKSAILSALLRSPIFFTTYLFKKEGLKLALGAMAAQFVFRTIFGGVNGAIIQSFSKVEPAWHAVLTIPLLLAAFSHVMEFTVQTAYDNYTGTNAKGKAIFVSIIISVLSAVFNLFVMRRGALLVKDENEQSIWRDLTRMPWLAVQFLCFPVIWTWRKTRKAQSR